MMVGLKVEVEIEVEWMMLSMLRCAMRDLGVCRLCRQGRCSLRRRGGSMGCGDGG